MRSSMTSSCALAASYSSAARQKLLLRYQLLFDKAAVLLVTPLFHCQFLIQANAFLFQPQMFLLHADAGIAQLVLLIGQIGFALHDADVQERIAETKNHIACLDDGSFLLSGALPHRPPSIASI